MKKLFTEEEYNSAKCRDLLSLKCYACDKVFQQEKHRIKSGILADSMARSSVCKYCSRECRNKAKCKYGIVCSLVNCLQCGRDFEKKNSQIAQTKNNFCSRSCAATWNNTHKTTGNRRSKLEVWIEQQLTNDYPNLTIKYNDKAQIGSELDVYVEDFKLAFELNGVFHYEAIYGDKKLEQVQNNDNRKFQACLEKKIELCVINSSGSKNFKPERDVKYLNIIKNILNCRISI